MAITNNGTKNSLPENQLPDGYTRPAVTTFSDHEYGKTVDLTIAKATVENATPATTMTNIINDAVVGITKQVSDMLAADFLGTATVTAYADLVALRTNMQSMAKGSPAYTNAAVSYIATVIIYIKTA